MGMKRHIIALIWLMLLALVGIIAFFAVRRMEGPGPGTKERYPSIRKMIDAHDPRKIYARMTPSNPVAAFINAYKTPIEFYGKVVDQHGEAVAGADIQILPFDNAFGDSDTSLDLTSDAGGRFSVKGLKGLAMGVQATKAGYLTFSDLGFEKPTSSRRIEYGLDGTQGACFKDPSQPTLFTLHKIGPVEPMVYVDEKRWRLPVDGTLHRIALDSQDGAGPHQIEYRFRSAWNQLPQVGSSNYKRFDWSLEARIPGGGFLKNDSDYNFEAPETGYMESIRFSYFATMPQEQWKRLRLGRHFVKFADGTFARIRFQIDGASDASDGALLMTSWMNLKPGSRNLASADKDNIIMPEQ